MTSSLEDEVRRIVASMESEEQHNQEQETPGTTEQEKEPDETIHIHYFPDAIVILKEDEETPQPHNAVETTLTQTKKPPVFIAYAICVFYLFLIFSCIAFQVYEILNPPIATVTIIPKTQQVTFTGTLQLGRIVAPITLSQIAIAPTTGKGHQHARAATGTITFYNGLFSPQTVSAGTILTSSSGVQIATDQAAVIPAANPPNLGQTTVQAHAIQTGTQGNIAGYDIDTPCCLTAVKARNTQAFYGGQNERNYQTVTQGDIIGVATTLKTTLTQSMQGALQGQLRAYEQLQALPCSPTVNADHHQGEEATQVKVTMSETCSAITYNTQELELRATQLLTTQATTQVGTGYSLIGDAHVTVKQATEHNKRVVLSFISQGTWVYAVTNTEQQRIKSLIIGKAKQEAARLLASLPGIGQASIRWGDETKLPKNTEYIRVVLMYGI